MTTYARIIDNTIVEIPTLVDSFTIAECFPAETVALFTEVPDGTPVGATLAKDGVTWTNPPITPITPSPSPAPPQIVYPVLTPMQFYLAFKPQERIAIKTSTDPVIVEFWDTFQLAVTANAGIDPNLASIQEGLTYLSAPTEPTVAIITAERIPQILTGVAQ